MNRLVLIDGNAILHRAYHALPPLTSPDGKLVNAVYGFTSMIFKIFNELTPTHMAVAFDRPGPTFRQKMYKQYQATRPKMDDELASQIDTVHEVVTAFGIPIFELDGYEADDVIGTLSHRAKQAGIDQIIIVTGDRDILQLVDDKTLAYMPTRGLSEAKLYEVKDVVERMGVGPQQVIDLKALAGDASDNYPGVSGIGPKTAVALLREFGSINKLYKTLSAKPKAKGISENIAVKLRAGQKNAQLSQDLATIRLDVPLPGSIETTHVETLNTQAAHDILTKLNFHSLIKRLDKKATPKLKPKQKHDKNKPDDNGQLSLV